MNENQGNKDLQVDVDEEEIQQIMQGHPKVTILNNKLELVKYQGFWHLNINDNHKSMLMFQRNFRARNSDIIIASFPKTGTTWLKSLLFAVINRFNYLREDNPLLKHHPHELVYGLEVDIYSKVANTPSPNNLNDFPSPRLLHTHLPYSLLPESIKTSGCRVLYISRNPLDTIVSFYHFIIQAMKKMEGEGFEPPNIEGFFEDFYAGRTIRGPFFEHVIEYWKESLERPNKALFFKYEDLKDDTKFHVKRLAEYVGMPFSLEEESKGVIEDIIKLCTISNLQELKANKSGVLYKYVDKKSYFRKGEVGDWRHHFTPSMAERMNKLMQEKLDGTGLSFRVN